MDSYGCYFWDDSFPSLAMLKPLVLHLSYRIVLLQVQL
jgi:hypothetical protein